MTDVEEVRTLFERDEEEVEEEKANPLFTVSVDGEAGKFSRFVVEKGEAKLEEVELPADAMPPEKPEFGALTKKGGVHYAARVEEEEMIGDTFDHCEVKASSISHCTFKNCKVTIGDGDDGGEVVGSTFEDSPVKTPRMTLGGGGEAEEPKEDVEVTIARLMIDKSLEDARKQFEIDRGQGVFVFGEEDGPQFVTLPQGFNPEPASGIVTAPPGATVGDLRGVAESVRQAAEKIRRASLSVREFGDAVRSTFRTAREFDDALDKLPK